MKPHLSPAEQEVLFEVVQGGISAAARLDQLRDAEAPRTEIEELKQKVGAAERARQELLDSNLGLIGKAAREVAWRYEVPKEDLKDVGKTALLLAIDGFNPLLGRFSTYALTILNRNLRDEALKLNPSKKRLIKPDGTATASDNTARPAPTRWHIPLDQEGIEEEVSAIRHATGMELDRSLDIRRTIKRFRIFLEKSVNSARELRGTERNQARRLVELCYDQLKSEGEAFRPDSPLDWRILIRILARQGTQQISNGVPDLAPSAVDLHEALVRREHWLRLLRTCPTETTC